MQATSPKTSINQLDHLACLKVADICALLKISQRAFYRIRELKQFPEPRRVGRAHRWLVSDVESYIQGLAQ